MKVRGIDHIVLTVSSIDKTCEFYEAVLGMKRVSFAGGRTALEFGRNKINLHPAGNEYDPKAKNPVPGSQDFCLIVDDLEQVQKALEENGIEIEVGPVEKTGAQGKLMSVYIRDPDQNLVELSEYVDA
jgi:catechol 2,3-dioxygenase-like lactoylglutathione lyase family enzyme